MPRPKPAPAPCLFEFTPEYKCTSLYHRSSENKRSPLCFIRQNKHGFYFAQNMQFACKNPPKPSKFFYEFLQGICQVYAQKMGISNYIIVQS